VQQLPEELGGPLTADLLHIYRSEGVEEIWSEKPAWGRVDDRKLAESGRRREHRKTSKTFIGGHKKVALIPC
jgi:hypothetical protein